ncbi:MAG: caspase family protein [Prevotella sp.]|nr:caspase family protein [Prevotella sp.]
MKKLLALMALALSIGTTNAQNIQQIQEKADKGDVYSQYLMGYNYHNGVNGIKDLYQARIWFEKAANNGYGAAAYYMGWYYYYGEGVQKDVNEAARWFTKASELGMVAARQMITICGNSAGSNSSSVEIDDFEPNNPPILELVANSVQFVDPNGNNAIDAGEDCAIKFEVINKGKGTAKKCIASVLSADVTHGLNLGSQQLPAILPGQRINITLPIKANLDLTTGKTDLVVQVNEPHGFGSDPVQLSVSTKQFTAPKLQIVDYAITSANGNKLTKKQPFDMQVLLQNLEYGTAENVVVTFDVPKGVLITSEGGASRNYLNINGGATKSLNYSLIVSDDFKGNIIPIDIRVKEKYGKYAQDKRIDLQLNQTLASNKIEVKEIESEQKSFTIETASLTSDVDKNIPEVKSGNTDNVFAVIIANESYNRETGVPFAANDGKIFAEYCKKTIGIPDAHVRLLTNATLNDMKHEINWLRQVIETRKGEAKVIFYYAGHGIPDEKDHQAYLLPVDGYGSDVSTGYSLNSLYKELGDVSSKSVVVLLDACFSGAKREGDMLASTRGIALKANRGEPQGNMVVISAAQGDETAYPYKKEGHGLFTYFLLKKIQESKGNVTLKELGNYLAEKVSQQSIVVNGKSQTPSIIVSNSIVDDWTSWKLK